MRHRAPQRSPEGAGPDRCPSPAARAGAPQLLQNPFEPQSAGPWQLPPVAMLNHRSSDLGMPVVSQHISGLVFFAKGTIGQYTIMIPSERLVIVRLGRSPNAPPEADGVFDLVRDVVAAARDKGKVAGVD